MVGKLSKAAQKCGEYEKSGSYGASLFSYSPHFKDCFCQLTNPAILSKPVV